MTKRFALLWFVLFSFLFSIITSSLLPVLYHSIVFQFCANTHSDITSLCSPISITNQPSLHTRTYLIFKYYCYKEVNSFWRFKHNFAKSLKEVCEYRRKKEREISNQIVITTCNVRAIFTFSHFNKQNKKLLSHSSAKNISHIKTIESVKGIYQRSVSFTSKEHLSKPKTLRFFWTFLKYMRTTYEYIRTTNEGLYLAAINVNWVKHHHTVASVSWFLFCALVVSPLLKANVFIKSNVLPLYE